MFTLKSRKTCLRGTVDTTLAFSVRMKIFLKLKSIRTSSLKVTSRTARRPQLKDQFNVVLSFHLFSSWLKANKNRNQFFPFSHSHVNYCNEARKWHWLQNPKLHISCGHEKQNRANTQTYKLDHKYSTESSGLAWMISFGLYVPGRMWILQGTNISTKEPQHTFVPLTELQQNMHWTNKF